MKKILRYTIISVALLICIIFTLMYIEIDNQYKNIINLEITDKYITQAQQDIINKGDNIETRLNLASAYLTAGEYQKALEIYSNISRNDSRGYWGQAIVYNQMHDYRNVLDSVDKLLENPFTKNMSTKDIHYQYQIVYKVKAQAHWKLHQYIKWAKVYKKTFYMYAKP